MKKVLLVILAVVCLGIGMVACTSEGTPKKENASMENTSGASENSSKDDEFSLNETAVFDDIKVTATEIKESLGKTYFEPENGNVFVGVKFTVENISQETQSISSILLFDAYVDDVKCDYSIGANIAFDEGTLDGEIAAGKKMVGWYAVEVPKEWKDIEFEVKSSWLSTSKAKFTFKNEK